jgi:hypothetical protein
VIQLYKLVQGRVGDRDTDRTRQRKEGNAPLSIHYRFEVSVKNEMNGDDH